MSRAALLPVSGLWIGDALPPMARLSMASFVECGHPYRLYAYRKFEGVPAGVEVRDAQEVLPDQSMHFKSVPPFANWFRLELLAREAGWWADMDAVCLKPLDIAGALAFGLQRPVPEGVPLERAYRRDPEYAHEGPPEVARAKQPRYSRLYAGPLINNAVLKSADPRHRLVRRLLSNCRNPERYALRCMARRFGFGSNFDLAYRFARRMAGTRSPEQARRWLRGTYASVLGGPWALTDEVVRMRLFAHVRPLEEFYPVHWKRWETLYDGTYAGAADPFPGSYAVHTWHKLSARRRPASGSFMDRMLRRHSIAWE